MSLGAAEITGQGKGLSGIGESRILTFGSIIISVLIDTMEVEFHMIQDQDMGFEPILERTILDTVDMKVTKSGTQKVKLRIHRYLIVR